MGALGRRVYSLPPEGVGQLVEARQPVVGGILEVRLAGRLVVVHRIAAPGSDPQWLPEHRAAAEAIALGRHGRHLRPIDPVEASPAPMVSLELGDGDYDVDAPDLDLFGAIGGPHPDDPWSPERGSQSHTESGFGGCECAGGWQ